jgi:hypothetical protein
MIIPVVLKEGTLFAAAGNYAPAIRIIQLSPMETYRESFALPSRADKLLGNQWGD